MARKILLADDDADVREGLGRLLRFGRPLDLTRTEFMLLEYLMQHPGTALTRARIHRHVWGFDFEPASNTRDVYVMYLRRKLESRGGPRLIHTVRGLGYSLRSAPPAA